MIFDAYLFIKINTLEKVKLQLAALESLFIAAKLIEKTNDVFLAVEWTDLTNNTYTKAELLEMEIDILKTLDFDVNIPTHLDFFNAFDDALLFSNNDNKRLKVDQGDNNPIKNRNKKRQMAEDLAYWTIMDHTFQESFTLFQITQAIYHLQGF